MKRHIPPGGYPRRGGGPIERIGVRAGVASMPPLVAIGLGGRVELWGDEIRIIKGGVFGHLAELLWLGYGLGESSVFLDQIASVEIVRSMILPDFIRFSYAGAPELSGGYMHDALAENALLMNLFDNRKFFELKRAVEARIIGRRPARAR